MIEAAASLSLALRRTLRSLARRPALAIAALVSLALGIGANIALFSVAHGVLLRPLPYPDEERIVRLWENHEGAQAMVRAPLLSDLTVRAWRESSSTLEGLGAYRRSRLIERRPESNVPLEGAFISPALFSLLGAKPVLGRLFEEEDAGQQAAPVVVLSGRFWQDRFGGDEAVLGQVLELDGKPRTIVGVADGSFHFPDREVALWVPYILPPVSTEPGSSSMRVFSALGKLKPGTTAAQAASEGTAIARAKERPPVADAIFGEGGPVVVSARQLRLELTESVRPAVRILAFGVGLILLICCANVANLLLSRGVSRQRELAVRTALGAERKHLIGQVVRESLLLSFGGGLLGLGLGAALIRILPALAPADFPRLEDIHLDGRTLAFALAATLATALLAGLLPALQASRFLRNPPLRGGAGSAGGGQAFPFGKGLLIAEAALAVMLLVAAGLLLHSFSQLLAVDTGYDRENVLAAYVLMPQGGSAETLNGQREEMLEALRGTPGVLAAGAGNMVPLSPATAISQFSLPASGPDGEPVEARAVTYVITPGYTEALAMSLKEGRSFTAPDLASGSRRMLVNEEFARSYLNDGEPVAGRRLDANVRGDDIPTEIIGVVGDVLREGLDDTPQASIYTLPRHGYSIQGGFNLLVRTSGNPEPLISTLRQRVLEVEPRAVLDAATLSSKVSASLSEPRFAAATLGAFALLALLLAATGLYSVLSYSVSRRSREMGIRSALGADRRKIVQLVLRQGLGVTALGLLLGVAGAALLTRWIETLLFGISPLDPLVFTAAPAVLLLVAVAACWFPARRAASTDPTVALRAE